MTALDTSSFEVSVEALIQQHVAAYESALRESLAQKFGAPRSAAAPGTRRRSSSRPTRRTASGSRRTAEEIDALAERFFAAVEAAPGEGMTVLAAGLGLRAQELERPVSRLKKAGRIRTVGERSRTRYYSMPAGAA